MNLIEKKEGPCVILAGAGTGKTHSIIEKIKFLIKNEIYPAEKIVCITFSNEAANNLLSRVQNSLDLKKEPIIKTFHSFSADLLREYGDKLDLNKDFKILTPEDAKVILFKNLRISTHYCHKYIGSIGTAKDLGITLENLNTLFQRRLREFENIDLEKRVESLRFRLQTLHLTKDREVRKELIKELKKVSELLEIKKFINTWGAYEKIKEKNNYQDYSDLNNNALLLLKRYKEIAEQFRYVIVDEFQDINKVQLDFLVELAPHRNITVVGDLNQSIYRFRGAYKRNFEEFKEKFSVQKQDISALDKSFRSPNKILRAAHKLILNNYKNKEDCFLVENSANREGEKIEIFELKNAREETRKVIELTEKEISQGTEPEEICIMCRTHQQGRIIKKALESKEISYHSVTKSPLLKNKSVKTAIDYLIILDKLRGKKRGGEQAWWDLIYKMEFLEEDLIKIGKFIRENKESENLSAKLLSSLDKLPLSISGRLSTRILIEKIKNLIPSTTKKVSELTKDVYNVAGLIERGDTREEKEAMLNLHKFLTLSLEYSSLYSPDLPSFISYLEILEDLKINISASELENSGVRLMTLHSTKGLEYKTVIITNLAQKRFPMERITRNTLIPVELLPEIKDLNIPKEDLDSFIREYERENQIMDERRLCYVAFTRAKENLILTYANEYAKKKHYPSQFLQEIKYKENEDTSFSTDSEEKYLEPEIQKAEARFSSILRSGDFDNILIKLIRDSEHSRKKVKLSTEGKTFSPSSLLTFAECQKKYEYKYVYNMPDKKVIAWEAIRMGSFIHLVLEMGVNKNSKTLKEFLNVARDLKLKEDWESVDLAEAEHLIKIFFERNKDKYTPESKTEQLLKMKLAGLQFRGFADRIDFSESGIEIIDYKTGKSTVSPRHRNWQLGYYALAASKLGKVKKITLDMLKQEKPLEFSLDEQGNAKSIHSERMEFNIYQIEEELIKTAHKIISAYENGFNPCPIERNCDFCNEYIYDL